LVVRKAPSRWIDSSFFQSAKEKSTTGLRSDAGVETSTSIRPYIAMTSATPQQWRPVDHVHGDGEGIAALALISPRWR
jgi:hypothetical protein